MATSSENPHDWEFSKENAAPLECGRSTKSLSKRAFGTSTVEMAKIEEKTKKYEKLVRRSEKAVEWIQKQSKRVIERADGEGAADRELTEEEAQTLRDRLAMELGFDPSTKDRDNVDFDPMRYWVLYIKHIRESYPSDSQKQFLLYERCARTFMARPFIAPSYQNDTRFIRTCILYADQTSNPSEVFKLMSKIKVGTKVSIFWVAWAWVAEKAQDFQFTEKIFQKALSVGAEPRKFLLDRQRHFLRRMSRHWLNASQAQEDGLEDEEEEDGRRGALNSLSSAGIARNDRGGGFNRQAQQHQNGSSRSSSRATSQQQVENKPTVGFSIFQDGDGSTPRDVFDDENAPGGRQRLTKESERTKENNMRPEQWNERGYGLVNPATAASSELPPIGEDSIVGTSRGVASAFGGPPAAGALQRSGSAAAFDVFVDEEFNTDDNDANDSSRCSTGKKVDERSLRQRIDGGTADRLARDPLRYMKNPSKMKSDQIKYDARPADAGESIGFSDKSETSNGRSSKADHEGVKQHKPAPKDSKISHRMADKQLPQKESSEEEEECCVFEQRLRSCWYKLVPPDDNINLMKEEANDQNNSSQMDFEESIEEIDMEEDDAEEIAVKPTKSVLKSSLRVRKATSEVLEEEHSGNMNPRRVLFGANTNVVYANTSLNTSTASSQPDGSFVKAEETINTKLANAEISMMFSSPNVNASLSETPGKSILASSFKQPMFSTSKKIATDDDNGCFTSKGSAFAIHDENKPEPGGLNFSIYQEDGEDGPNGLPFTIHDEKKSESGGLNFSIYNEDSNESADKHARENKPDHDPPFAIHDENKPEPGGLNFSIFQEDSNESARDKPNGLPFAIHDERKSRNSGDDTASLSVLGNILADIDSKEKTAPSSRNKTDNMAEDTASLSLINGVMDGLENCSVNEPPQKPGSGFAIFTDENPAPPSKEPLGFKIFADDDNAHRKPPKGPKPSEGLGFQIFSDQVTGSAQKKQKVESNNELFVSDISRIEDEKTSNFQIMDENEEATSLEQAIDYATLHKNDMESTMRKCMHASAKSRRYQIFDYRKNPMPKALLRKSFTSGTTIDLLGGETLSIVHELGRGAYGVVLLCKDGSDQSDALKIQAPIGSLAHEYSLLLQIDKRVQNDPSGFYPFPRSLGLYAFSEGGLFSMTAGSDSGMTLIDVVNTYKKITGNCPELIAIYYTSRMLKHLESLHQDAKVLHCDIKPDNWVLTISTEGSNNAGENSVGGSDIMLVDFGRSIDLEKVANEGSDPLKTQFKGSIAAEDMECISMRKGLPWGIDLDLFGLAASSFILLFGSHMEVVQDRITGKWRPTKPFRRYWQRDLWKSLFDLLLNFDSSSDQYSLREIRTAFEEYIDGKQRKKEIATHLNQLYTHLPKKR